MKQCGTCGEVKDESQFSKNKSKSDGLHSKCKSCHSAYLKGHYAKNLDYYKVKARRAKLQQYDKNRAAINGYLADHPCVDCGKSDPVVLEFDHVRGVKIDSVSVLAFSLGVSVSRVMAEIGKCDVRCANCHRRRTARQFGFGDPRFCPPDIGIMAN